MRIEIDRKSNVGNLHIYLSSKNIEPNSESFEKHYTNETKIVYTDKLSEIAKKFKQKVVYLAFQSDFTSQLQVCAKMLPKKA